MKALVVYASFTGNTRIVAYEIADGLREGGVEVSVVDVRMAREEDVSCAAVVVVGSATHGGRPMKRVFGFFDGLFPSVFDGKTCAVYAVNGFRGGSKVIEELSRLLMEKGAEYVVAGPVFTAGIPFLPVNLSSPLFI